MQWVLCLLSSTSSFYFSFISFLLDKLMWYSEHQTLWCFLLFFYLLFRFCTSLFFFKVINVFIPLVQLCSSLCHERGVAWQRRARAGLPSNLLPLKKLVLRFPPKTATFLVHCTQLGCFGCLFLFYFLPLTSTLVLFSCDSRPLSKEQGSVSTPLNYKNGYGMSFAPKIAWSVNTYPYISS